VHEPGCVATISPVTSHPIAIGSSAFCSLPDSYRVSICETVYPESATLLPGDTTNRCSKNKFRQEKVIVINNRFYHLLFSLSSFLSSFFHNQSQPVALSLFCPPYPILLLSYCLYR
jgi:hypothetical protein